MVLWLIAAVLTLSAVVYQRVTGPTHEKKIRTEMEGNTLRVDLIRSHVTTSDALVELEIPDTTIRGTLVFRRYPTGDPWRKHHMVRMKTDPEILAGVLPVQPAAGKLEYYVVLEKNDVIRTLPEESPVIIRFKDPVPDAVLVPHVFLMFLAMLFSTAALLFALFRLPAYRSYTFVTFWFLLAGGMILGPIVQKFAFGSFWTGFPLGQDLTDSKTLIAFAGYLVAFLGNRKKERRTLTIMAAILLLLVYSIPHSLFGSELDYEKGEIIQGMIHTNWL